MAEPFDDGLVLFGGFQLEIVEELAALIHHLEQAAAGSVITLVGGEMLAQTVDSLAQQCDLNFWRSGVFGIPAILSDDAAFLLTIQ